MRGVRVPLFIAWKNPNHITVATSQHPYLTPLASHSQDSYIASCTPPWPSAPHVFMLFLRGEGRPHPYLEQVERRLHPKPAGPFQRPGESRTAFLARMRSLQESILARESPAQRERRMDRITYSLTGQPPRPYTRVFLWVKAGDVAPELPEEWHSLDYRTEVHPGAVRGLWHVHSSEFRQYHSAFDEWDLWSEVCTGTAAVDESSTSPLPTYSDPAAVFTADNDFLYQDDPEPELPAIEFDNEYLQTHYLVERYGLHRAATTFPEVDYDEYANENFYKILGVPPGHRMILAEEEKKVYAGWIWAQMHGKVDSRALAECWDMDARSPHFMFKDANITRFVRVRRANGLDGSVLFHLEYIEDATGDQCNRWSLSVNSRVLLYLLRCLPHVKTSHDAVHDLSTVGAPFHTVRDAPSLDGHPVNRTIATGPSLLPALRSFPHRHDNHRHTFMDYRQYRRSVLELLRSGPHARAALTHGGIIWRLAMEFTRTYDGTLERVRSYLDLGPSEEIQWHRVVIQEAGRELVDDCLTEQELDIMSGVSKIYTGEWYRVCINSS